MYARTRILLAVIAILAPISPPASPAAAQGAGSLDYLDALPPLLDRDVFFGNPQITGGQISPDGRHVSFLRPLDGVLNVWVKGVDEPFEAARPITADTTRPVTGYSWSADGEWVLYVQDKGGDENFHVYAVDPDGSPEPGKRVPAARDLTPYGDIQARIMFLPDDDPRHIVVGINDRDPQLHDVYRLDLRTGERELLRENTEGSAGYLTDLEGRVRLGLKITSTGETEISRIDPDGSEVVYTCSNEESCGPIRFHPDGRRVYLQTNRGDRDLTELVLLDPGTGDTESVESDPEGEVDFSGVYFSAATDELLATAYEGDRTRWYPRDEAFARDLERIREQLPEGDLSFRSMTEDGSMFLVSVSRDVEPSSTWIYDRDTGRAVLLYRTRPEIDPARMAEMRPVRYPARDGLEIPAYLTLPNGVDAEDLAVIIMPHGGPWARDFWGYDGFAQFLANRGYGVLQPNFRGSTGYGKRFLNLGNEEWGTGTMQHDITDAVRWLVSEGIADPEKVGIMGGSYGGYATLAGLAFTPDLYAVGVDIVGPSSIVTLLNSIPPYWAPIRAIFDVRVGDLEDPHDLARLEAQSPLNSAAEITAPLLVIQGANDPRVNKRESDQIVVTLRDLGREVDYMVYPDEGHGVANEDNRLAMIARIEEFLARHLGGRYQATMEPGIEEIAERVTVDVDTLTLQELSDDADGGETIESFDASVETGTTRLRQVVEQSGQRMESDATRTVAETMLGGETVVVVVDEASGAMGAGVDSTYVAAGTLVPLRRAIRQGQVTVEMEFAGGSVSGGIEAGPQQMPLSAESESTLFVAGGALELGLASLDLAPGGTATIHLFSPLEGTAKEYRVTHGGVESVETAAGSFETRRIELSARDGSGSMTYWIAGDPGRVVRSRTDLPATMGGGTVTSEVTGSGG